MGLHVAEPDRDATRGGDGAAGGLRGERAHPRHHRPIRSRWLRRSRAALFHRSGDPELGYEDMQEVMPYIMQLQADEIEADLEATFAHLAGMGYEGRKVAVIGFCMGGSISFVAGAYWQLGAAASFYGGGIAQSRFGLPPLLDLAPTLQTPWLGLFGDLDGSIPINEVEGLREAAAKAAPDTEVVRYPEANHGFHCDARSSYHEESAKDAWQRTLTFFDQHLA